MVFSGKQEDNGNDFQICTINSANAWWESEVDYEKEDY